MNKSTSDMLHHLSNLEVDELDAAINHLTRARKSRAEMRSLVAFKIGDKVTFPWHTKDQMHTGEFVGTYHETGKICVASVIDHEGKPYSGTCVVDALKVDHLEGDEDEKEAA